MLFFYPCQVYFHNQCVALKFQMESETYVKKSESKCIFSLELFYVSANVKRIRNYGLKCNLYLRFSIQHRLIISGEKMLISAEIKRCVA